MIRFRDLTKRYGTHDAVAGLNMEVAAGEVVALLGPNGSGKTTSLKAAAGLIRPTSGGVAIGAPPRPATDPEARASISFLPQRVAFPEALTGREVVEFYRALRAAPASATIDVLRFASLNGAADRAVATYSGGMVQRLGLAVALVARAPVLLLDEPTAALDPDGLCAFYGLLDDASRRPTVLFSSHQIGDVERLANRFAILVEGRLIASLTRAELRERLAERGVMRLRFARPVDAAALAVARRVAGSATTAGDELIVPGPARIRPSVLDALRAAGAEIRGLTADEGRLEMLYQDLVREHSREREK